MFKFGSAVGGVRFPLAAFFAGAAVAARAVSQRCVWYLMLT
jgi:hypothetical protein